MPEFDAALELSKQIVMRAEVTAGVDVLAGAYLAADIIEADVRSIRVTNDPNEIENLIVKGNLGRAPSIKGPRVARIDFRVPIRGSLNAAEYDDTPETVPTADRPLRACRLARSFTNPGGVGNSQVDYKPTSSGETFTVYVVGLITGTTALARQFVGCQGTARVVGVAGEGTFYEFSLVGAFEEEVEITYVPGVLVHSPQFPTLVNAAFQIGPNQYTPRIRNVGFDLGQRVGRLPSINAASGVAGFKVVDRRPTLQIDPEIDAEANGEWWPAFRDGAPMMDCTFQLGSAHLNRLKFKFGGDGTTPNLQVVSYDLDSRDDVICARLTLLATIGAGNDDWTLTYD
jgi:hypothetical protein